MKALREAQLIIMGLQDDRAISVLGRQEVLGELTGKLTGELTGELTGKQTGS